MAAGRRRGRKPRASAIDTRSLTGLTYDELRALLSELEETTKQLPRPLFLRLRRLIAQLITRQYHPWSREYIKRLRWSFVAQGRRIGPEWGWDELRYACEVLKGTPAEAEHWQMKKDYDAVQRCLPDEARASARKPNRKTDEGARFDRDFMVRAGREWAFHNIPGWPIENDGALPNWVIKG